MKKIKFTLILLLAALVGTAFLLNDSPFKSGDPGIKSVNALAFSDDGTLFIGDSKSATIVAIKTNDKAPDGEVESPSIANIDEEIAKKLGTTTDNIQIQDMVVNPVSKEIYIAVHTNDGTPLLLKISGEAIENVNLKQAEYSSTNLNNAPAEDAKDRRGRSLRVWAISDLNVSNNRVFVTGLSNQEFASTFRVIPFPFKGDQMATSLEIYHAAHGQYETHSPVKTFTTAMLNGKEHIIASYTCTPLVLFPVESLKDGEHNKGRTVAEFGNGNTPLDMVVMEKEGKSYLLMANSNRPVMKVKFEDIEKFEDSLTEPVNEPSATEGVEYISFPWVNVVQMDKLDDSRIVMLQRDSRGNLNLRTQSNRWL